MAPPVEQTRKRPLGSFIGLNALAATTCFFVAWLGELLLSEAVYGSPLWPTTGLALAILIKEGRQTLPGIWLGGFAFMLFHVPLATDPLLVLLVPTATTLQAMLGARLAAPLCHAKLPMARERDLLKFLLLVGPLACVVVPSALSLLFVLTGDVGTLHDFFIRWFSLWVHDSIGSVMLAPIVLLAWPGTPRLWPYNSLRVAVMLIATMTLLIVGNVFFDHLKTSEKQQLYARFTNEVFYSSLLPLEIFSESMNNITRLFSLKRTITHEEFADFTSFALSRPELLGIDWVPRVTDAALPAFIAAARRDGMPDYQVFELDDTGQPVPVQPRAFHYPVLYRTTIAGAPTILGLDHGFDEVRRDAMDKAATSGKLSSALVRLKRNGQRAIFAFRPVFDPKNEDREPDSATRPSALRGFIITIYDIDRLFADLQQAASRYGFALRVSDVTPKGGIHVLVDGIPADGKVAWRQDVAQANGIMRIEMSALDEAYAHTDEISLLAYHFFGLLAGLLLSYSVLAFAGRQASISAKVAERTVELRRLQAEAEKANQAKSTFLSTMSHEIRTPMNGLIGTLELLEHSRLNEQQIDHVQTMRVSASTLLALINDILDFSKIEAGHIELEQTQLCIADLVENLCISKANIARTRGVSLRIFIDPDLPTAVLGDDTRLRQVLYNLISNALKFSSGNPERSGQVHVRAVPVTSEPLRVAFSISDNGIGIEPDMQARLFTPFLQAEASTTRRFGGTGLGLAICKTLVTLMGGEISISSTPGEGSTFTVTIPFTRAPEQPEYVQPDLSGISCFLLEDAAMETQTLLRYLDAAGAAGVRCSDPSEALHHAATIGPAVLIHPRNRNFDCPAKGRPTRFGCVCIGQGRRRRARRDASGCISVDADVLRRQVFLQAVAVAGGRAPAETLTHSAAANRPTDDSPPPPSVAQARAENRLILVVEDDSVNQKVILQQLALLGFAAEIAEDGAKALALWSKGGFALLLTDLHMPTMDGYQLSAAIRRLEHDDGHTPIIALTANALHNDFERARSSGIDAYLTKPVTLVRLREMLDDWLPRNDVATSGPPASVLDPSVLQQLVGDEQQVIHTLLTEYADSIANAAVALRSAFAQRNFAAMTTTAHRLKSSSRAVGALELGELFAEIETAGRFDDHQAMVRCMAQFENMLTAIEARLDSLISGIRTDENNNYR